MPIYTDQTDGSMTFVVIVQHEGQRFKKRFSSVKFDDDPGLALQEAQKWEREIKLNARLQSAMNIRFSAEMLAELSKTDRQAKELNGNLRKVLELGLEQLKRLPAAQRLTFSQAVARYLPEFELTNKSEHYFRQVELRFTAFGRDFGDRFLDEISSDNIQEFLLKRTFAPNGSTQRPQPLGTTAWNNWLRDFSVFFNWCIKRKYLNDNPASGVVKKVKSRAELAAPPPTWDPEHCQEVIDACRSAWNHRTSEPAAARGDVPYIYIGILCGLRPNEIERLRWERHFDWEQGTIWVSQDIAKTKQNRWVPMPENLVRILEPYRKDSGAVSDSSRNVYQRLRKAGFSLPQDTLRHTFASWHVALYEEPAKTAFLLGHGKDSDMLFSKYRALMKKDTAARYLQLR